MGVASLAWGAERVQHSEGLPGEDLDSILCALRLLLFVDCCEAVASKVLRVIGGVDKMRNLFLAPLKYRLLNIINQPGGVLGLSVGFWFFL